MSTAAVKIEYTKLFINNEFVDAESKKTFPSVNPRTGEVITHVAEADEQDVNKAVKAARTAFRGEWGHLSSGARSLLLNKLADAVEKHKLELAAIDSLDNGKTFGMAVAFDLDNVIKTIRYFAGWADKITGKTMPFEGGFFAYTRHEPVGVVGAVIPWNFPLAMLGWKIAPALAAGNTIIIKTSEKTPLSALRFAAIVKEVGIPAGVVNILSGYGPTAGHALAAHPDVDLIAFTGSTATGRRIMHAAADSNLKKVCLELGGKSPVVVFEDVDLDQAVEGAHSALFFNAGQVCCAGSRTYVHEKVYDEFVKKSVERAKKIKLTHHDNEDPFAQGPQVDEIQHKSVLNWIEKGKASGAKLLTGGGIPKDTPGYYVEPTVFADVPDDAIIAKEEIFGPVQSIMKFKSVEEIIERANTSFYGLAASVWTKDISKAHALAAGIKAGTVWVNCHNILDPAIPFGGFKQSGTGRDLSEYALQTYTQPKAVVIKL